MLDPIWPCAIGVLYEDIASLLLHYAGANVGIGIDLVVHRTLPSDNSAVVLHARFHK
jgi:hypothetical protein